MESEAISLAAESPFKYRNLTDLGKKSSPNWKREAEDTEWKFWSSNHGTSCADYLSQSCTFDNSLKLWQPTPYSSGGYGHVQQSNSVLYDKASKKPPGDDCLRAALVLDYSWALDSMIDSQSGSNPSSTMSVRRFSRAPDFFLPSTESGNTTSPSSGTASTSVLHESVGLEIYSRKVFIGGLPPDTDEDKIVENFLPYGVLTVDWPHKDKSKAYFPPKSYAFLVFQEEYSVHILIKSCTLEDGKLYMFVSNWSQTNIKKVQIKPWKLSDSNWIVDHTQPIDQRKTIFVGGVPRPLNANKLAEIFNSQYGNVCYSSIDCDPKLKYPKGAGRVTFTSRVSFMNAVSCRFFKIIYGNKDKMVKVRPYVLDDQECDECHGAHCDGQFAPYFCGTIHCLRYYCEHCWIKVHSAPKTQNHCCFIKKNGGYPRAINLSVASGANQSSSFIT